MNWNIRNENSRFKLECCELNMAALKNRICVLVKRRKWIYMCKIHCISIRSAIMILVPFTIINNLYLDAY